MKIVTLYSLFFILSTLLIVLTLTEYMQGSLVSINIKETRVKKSKKNYMKRREEFVPIRTLSMGQQEIDRILNTNPYIFNNKSIEVEHNSSNLIKKTLLNLVNVLNHLDEEAILVINTYADKNGSKQYNLALSQKRADFLKKYFRERVSLPLISAIGYSEVASLKKEDKSKHKQVEINLKRIK